MGALALVAKTMRRSPKNKKKLFFARGYAAGGEVDDEPSEVTLLPRIDPNRPKGGLGQVSLSQNSLARDAATDFNPNDKGTGGPELNKKTILDKAIANLQGRIHDPNAIRDLTIQQLQNLQQQGQSRKAELERMLDPSGKDARLRESERMFALSAALAKPQQRGSGFGGFLQNVGAAGQGYAKSLLDERKINAELEKEKAGLEYDPRVLQALKQGVDLGAPSSSFGKQAADEGLAPGSPEYIKRVRELHQEDVDTKRLKVTGGADNVGADGMFDRKTGNFITGMGTIIPKTEVTKDRAERGNLLDTKKLFQNIDKKTIKASLSVFNVTGAGMTGEVGKGIAGTISPDTLDAQTRIYTQAIEGIQKALPPGPASDKDVQQAKATFPGFSSEKALKNWLRSLEDMVDIHIRRQDDKYGSGKWYGNAGAPQPKDERNDLGETPSEQKRLQEKSTKSGDLSGLSNDDFLARKPKRN